MSCLFVCLFFISASFAMLVAMIYCSHFLLFWMVYGRLGNNEMMKKQCRIFITCICDSLKMCKMWKCEILFAANFKMLEDMQAGSL